ncbi:NADPH:quinone reductase-like Zn-dependent oxidoreductase [Saonia flava]|uniref:NADPH:quinone reductase-like Zn-dependent oxidoreductase n=1 Tax=Saonia flava TaxID=523696 RepID=A0A846QS43_9FLAO|nr:NAD(P)-dependent alcohol dehydrogenase [Saonia flava]NJB69790.1 NADPH:quinone reductase-like Zn-dependent oxidoreductase [Saonia flava]
MKAVIYTKYGGPEVLQYKEVETPQPKENEILVKVHATTVNRTDCAAFRGAPFVYQFFIGLFKPKRKIAGTTFSGEIVQLGSGVTTHKIGDRIFGFNDNVLSSYAEYMVIKENSFFATIPENISYEHAAASIEGEHYARNFINKVTIKKGQNILVNGASGAIGSAMVQILKSIGADITAVTNTKNMELVKSLGASEVIDYTKEDFTKMNGKFDFVFDTVGKSTFGKCKPILKPEGVYISSELGPWSQNIFYSIFNKHVKFPMPSDINASLSLVKRLMTEGKHTPVIDRTYSLEHIPEAYTYVEKGEKTGNVVITV